MGNHGPGLEIEIVTGIAIVIIMIGTEIEKVVKKKVVEDLHLNLFQTKNSQRRNIGKNNVSVKGKPMNEKL